MGTYAPELEPMLPGSPGPSRLPLQGPRYSIPYFVNPKLNYTIQGPQKRWGPVTGFDLLSKTGARQSPSMRLAAWFDRQPGEGAWGSSVQQVVPSCHQLPVAYSLQPAPSALAAAACCTLPAGFASAISLATTCCLCPPRHDHGIRQQSSVNIPGIGWPYRAYRQRLCCP